MSTNWPGVIDAVADAVVRVRSGSENGTGFLSERGLVTAAHVLKSPSDIQVECKDGAKARAELLPKQDLASVDLAILKVDLPPSIPRLALRNISEARVGHEVIFAGYPLESSMPLTVHKAMVAYVGQRSFKHIRRPNIDCLQLDGSVNLGNSGGPVIGADGQVLGIVNARFGDLTDFLDGFLKEQKESRDYIGPSFEALAGVVDSGGKRYKQFSTKDAQSAFIDIVTMLRRHTNVGIGWAVASDYVRLYA